MSVIETDTADVQVSSTGATSHVNGYKIMQLLGEGAFSKVYHCQNGDGKEFALKILNKSFLKRKREYKRVDGKMVLSNAFQKVQREVAIMKKLSHPNLVKLHEVIDSPADDKLFLVLELIRGGQIMDWDDKDFRYKARATATGVLDKATVRECLRDVVDALDYLHRNHICHRDIKPENILLSATGYKLADFGVAHMREDESPASGDSASASTSVPGVRLRSTEGTYHFLAPECTTGDEFDPYQVDVWALGVTMLVLLVGTLPFGTHVASLSGVMDSIREDPLVLPDLLDPECAELIGRLLEKDPRWRITLPQLKKHPWLVGYPGSDIADAVAAVQAQRPTPSAGMEVHVTQQEIEAAFTPVNNFILMTKLKMKMALRLSRARKALATTGERSMDKVPVTQHVSVPATSSTPISIGGANGKEDGDSKTCEMALSELSSPKLQKRQSRIMETFTETMEVLNTTLTRRKSHMGAVTVTSAFPTSSETGKARVTSSTTILVSTTGVETPETTAFDHGDATTSKPMPSSKPRMLPRRLSRRDTASNGALAPSAATTPLAPSPEGAEDDHDHDDAATKTTKRELSPSKGSPLNSPVGSPSGSSALKPKFKMSPGREAQLQLQPLRASKLPVLELDSLSALVASPLSPVASPRLAGEEEAQETLEGPRSKTPPVGAGSPKSSVRLRNLSAVKTSHTTVPHGVSSANTTAIPGCVARDDEVAVSSNGAGRADPTSTSNAEGLKAGNRAHMSSLKLGERLVGDDKKVAITSPRGSQSPRRSSSPHKTIMGLVKQRSPPASPRSAAPRNLSLNPTSENHGALAVFSRSSSLAKALDQCLTPDQKDAMRKFQADEENEDKASASDDSDAKTAAVTPLPNSASPTKRNVVVVPPIALAGAKPDRQTPAPREEKPSRVLAAFDRAASQQPKPLDALGKPGADAAAASPLSSSPGNSPKRSKDPSGSHRRSILEAQDSLRVLMRRKSSVKLIMTDARAATAYAPSDGQAPTAKPKTGVCAIM